MVALSILPLLFRIKSLLTNKLFIAALLFGAFAFIIWRTHTAAFEAGEDAESLRSAEQTVRDLTSVVDEIAAFHAKREEAEREQNEILHELRQERAALFERLREEEDDFSIEFSDCFSMPVPDGLRIGAGTPGAGDRVP